MKEPILHIDAGSVTYPAADRWQRGLHARRVAREIPDLLLFLEHPHVLTMGRRFSPDHLKASRLSLQRAGVALHEADRGGSITYHGPGQIVVWPVVDLRRTGSLPDLIGYLRLLERAIIAAAGDHGVAGEVRAGLTGVWAGGGKLASIGVNASRGVTRHGLALNVGPDLRFFDRIVPCGIEGARATSMEQVLGHPVSSAAVAAGLARHLARELDRMLVPGDAGALGFPPPAGPGTDRQAAGGAGAGA